MNVDFDVCIIGSGAGGSPIAHTLTRKGYSVVVLEKGPWYGNQDYSKDELAAGRRPVYKSNLTHEPHVVEVENGPFGWQANRTDEVSGWDFWNGNVVGGATNFMSGFFHRLKPIDFRLRSEFGPIDGANLVDWPITYDELEPYYNLVEKVVGVSGRVVDHPNAEPRSSNDFPFAPTAEHAFSTIFDEACGELGYHSIPTPRAVLSRSSGERSGCSYNGYCGGYGCITGAKGSSRAALLPQAIATGKCEVRPESMVYKLESDNTGKVSTVHYFDKHRDRRTVSARIYVVACQAIETARLLLLSTGPRHPRGLANGSAQVGRNLLFAGGGAGSCRFPYDKYADGIASRLKQYGPFVNRSLQDWYIIDDKKQGPRQKGGTIDFLLPSVSPIGRAVRMTQDGENLVWGSRLKRKLESHFRDAAYLKFEAFSDWLPVDDCFVGIDPVVKDKWGLPVARVRSGMHTHIISVGWYLAERGASVLRAMGGEDVISYASGTPPTNLVAGTCRFGDDPASSVLDRDCRAHEVENLYVTDASFQPTGGSVPYTWTVYANAFRVADKITEHLGQNI